MNLNATKKIKKFIKQNCLFDSQYTKEKKKILYKLNKIYYK